jgi:hypothetical protein
MWLLVIVEAADGGAVSHFECVDCDEANLEARSRSVILNEVYHQQGGF